MAVWSKAELFCCKAANFQDEFEAFSKRVRSLGRSEKLFDRSLARKNLRLSCHCLSVIPRGLTTSERGTQARDQSQIINPVRGIQHASWLTTLIEARPG